MEPVTRSISGVNILELHGRFDAYETAGVVKWFEANPQVEKVVMNLTGVSFIDSSGLATLVKGLKRCRQNSGDLYLSNLQQAIVIILELTHLNSAFKIFNDEAAALRAFAGEE
jgi:anti-sigma B factor antagonist